MRQSRHAFSLVELLVVMSIIAVLAGMLLPAISLVRQSALTGSCKSKERQLGMAMAVYAQDQDGFLPTDWNRIYTTSNTYWHTSVEYNQLLDLPVNFTAAQKRTRFRDPADKDTSANNMVGPTYPGNIFHVSDYAANVYMVARISASYPFRNSSMRMSAITHPSEALLLTCGAAGLADGNDWWLFQDFFDASGTFMDGTGRYKVVFRHGGKTLNQVMGDLHVETRQYPQVPPSAGNLATSPGDPGRQYWMKNP